MTEASAVGVPESATALVLEISISDPTCAATADALPGGAGVLMSALAENGEKTSSAQAGTAAKARCRRVLPFLGKRSVALGDYPEWGMAKPAKGTPSFSLEEPRSVLTPGAAEGPGPGSGA
jgi:hypothetical protein